MNSKKLSALFAVWSRAAALIALATAFSSSGAATLWTGPNTNFTQSASAESDVIVPGKVVLTRGNNGALYNTAAGERSPGSASPADTMWAFGSLNNYSTLTYQSLDSLRNGDLAGRILNQPMVVHLVNENIYLSVKFTAWGQHFAGGFAYTRSTPAVAVPPTVTITTPAAGAVFAAPASVNFTVTTGGGTVTNVQYFAGATRLGASPTPPFSFTGSLPNPGPYALAAVATAGGISATSPVVNITVVAPVPVALGQPGAGNGQFSFSYSASPGLSYVIQRSSNLVDWASVVTNTASGSAVVFSEALAPTPSVYYRVGRLPNH